jgi:hypothetical protein
MKLTMTPVAWFSKNTEISRQQKAVIQYEVHGLQDHVTINATETQEGKTWTINRGGRTSQKYDTAIAAMAALEAETE